MPALATHAEFRMPGEGGLAYRVSYDRKTLKGTVKCRGLAWEFSFPDHYEFTESDAAIRVAEYQRTAKQVAV